MNTMVSRVQYKHSVLFGGPDVMLWGTGLEHHGHDAFFLPCHVLLNNGLEVDVGHNIPSNL